MPFLYSPAPPRQPLFPLTRDFGDYWETVMHAAGVWRHCGQQVRRHHRIDQHRQRPQARRQSLARNDPHCEERYTSLRSVCRSSASRDSVERLSLDLLIGGDASFFASLPALAMELLANPRVACWALSRFHLYHHPPTHKNPAQCRALCSLPKALSWMTWPTP